MGPGAKAPSRQRRELTLAAILFHGQRCAREVVAVIVLVLVDGEGARCLGAEEPHILGMLRDRLGLARTADVTVHANDAVALRHNDVQIVADEQDADTARVANAPDKVVQLRLARVVDAAHRLIENEELGLPQERACENDALKLAARELRELLADHACRADLAEGGFSLRRRVLAAEREKARDGHGNCRIAIEALGGVSDGQTVAARDCSAIGAFQAEQDAHEGGLAGAIGADQRDDLARREIEVHALENGPAGAREVHVAS